MKLDFGSQLKRERGMHFADVDHGGGCMVLKLVVVASDYVMAP